MSATYDRIGVGYGQIRRPDPRLASLINEALAGAHSVVNIGAGAGSYEPTGVRGVSVDPSEVMLAQHPGRTRVRANAEALPFPDHAFDAAMAIMTIHHWTDWRAGLAEMCRVSDFQVLFTWDKDHDEELWLVSEYLPEIRALERPRHPPISAIVSALGGGDVVGFPIPYDFTDGYQPAFWRRPEAFLDPAIRAASSTFATLSDEVVGPAIRRLEADLASGAWQRRHKDLFNRHAVDYGYRLITSR